MTASQPTSRGMGPDGVPALTVHGGICQALLRRACLLHRSWRRHLRTACLRDRTGWLQRRGCRARLRRVRAHRPAATPVCGQAQRHPWATPAAGGWGAARLCRDVPDRVRRDTAADRRAPSGLRSGRGRLRRRVVRRARGPGPSDPDGRGTELQLARPLPRADPRTAAGRASGEGLRLHRRLGTAPP